MRQEIRELRLTQEKLIEAMEQRASTSSHPPATPSVVTADPLPSANEEFDVGRLKETPGAIFDFLYPLIKTPRNVMDAFNIGFAGCPPIDSMESRESEYARVWRNGGKRYKQFAVLKLVNDKIAKIDSKDRVQYTLTMHMKYTGKEQGALATLAKAISKPVLPDVSNVL